jgi:hypothetical protein
MGYVRGELDLKRRLFLKPVLILAFSTWRRNTARAFSGS